MLEDALAVLQVMFHVAQTAAAGDATHQRRWCRLAARERRSTPQRLLELDVAHRMVSGSLYTRALSDLRTMLGHAAVAQAVVARHWEGCKGDEVEGDGMEGDEVEGDGMEGDEVEGDEVEGDGMEVDSVAGAVAGAVAGNGNGNGNGLGLDARQPMQRLQKWAPWLRGEDLDEEEVEEEKRERLVDEE